MHNVIHIVQKAGIVTAYIIYIQAMLTAILYLTGIIMAWNDFEDLVFILYEFLYSIALILFTRLCVVRWLKQNRLSSLWMVLSMLVSAIIIYALLDSTCRWEPAVLRHHGMDLYAPWWLGGHRQFFVGLTPETVPLFHKINILDNSVFHDTIIDFPGLFVWVFGCCISYFFTNHPINKAKGQIIEKAPD